MKYKSQSMELMKILSDPRRNQILHLASDEPITVKELAEKIGEEPLRLYYHIKKLMKADLLEVVDTRQHGNLTEKYYKTANFRDVIYKGDFAEQAEYIEQTLSLIHQKIDPGIQLYQKRLEIIRNDKKEGKESESIPIHVSVDSATERKTGRQWRESIEPIMKAMAPKSFEESAWPELPDDERDDEEGTYQYVLVSYRLEDTDELYNKK